MKNIKYLVVLLCMTFVSVSSFAQEKELQTESDGFRWYELRQGDKRGAQSVGGTTFIPLSRGYTFICYFSSDGGWFGVRKGDKKEGVCDITGREIIAPGRYDYASYYWNEDGFVYCRVELNGKKGICDMNGREIIAPGRYDWAGYRNEDGFVYWRVELNGQEGICDMNGREIIAPRYENLIVLDGVFKYEDASGKWVSTGIKLSSLAQAPSTNPTPSPAPTPTPQPQPQPQPRPMQVWKPCVSCGGSGQCHICLGTGHSLQNPNSTCILCNGTGKCTHCAGHGGQNVIEYH